MVAEDRGFEPLRAVNPTRFPSERHRPLGESSAEEATGAAPSGEIRRTPVDWSAANRSPRLGPTPHVAPSCRTPPGPEGSKGRRALPGTWGAFACMKESPADRGFLNMSGGATPDKFGERPPST